MDLLTISVFAQAAGLTAKALRLYDQVGLLPPAAVDPETGYRLYDPAQLGHARLIAELRRIGMPLAEIRTVCDLEPGAAAAAVDAYWQRVSADNASRARQAALLVEQLSPRDDTLIIRCAARCDPGLERDTNEDAASASDHLFAVADGMRGAAGAAASTAAIEALTRLELPDLSAVAATINAVDQNLRRSGSAFTTLTALLRRGSQLALVHIGDTRAYLLRAGELTLLTQDHTWVRDQVEHGRLTAAEAAAHPRRALLTRALGGGPHPVEADLALRTALPGDRYLLCSDGLSAVVPRADIHAALTTPGDTAQHLIDLAHAAGAPDNIAVVIADVSR